MTGPQSTRRPDRTSSAQPRSCNWRRLGISLLLIAGALSCRDFGSERKPPQAEPGRVWPGDPIALAPGVSAGKINLGGVVKNAAPVSRDRPLRLKVTSGRRLLLALGVLPGSAERPVKFRLGPDGATLLETIVDSRTPSGWREFTLELPSELEGDLLIECDLAGPGAYVAHPREFDPGAASRPWIFLVLIDALRADALGAYGAKDGASPNLDLLAAQGVVFDRAHTSSSFTLTSLASIFTSLHPWRHRVMFSEDAGLTLSDVPPNLVLALHRAGYHTAAFSGTRFRLSHNGFARGFDHFDETCADAFFRDSAECLNRRIIEWLETGAADRGPAFVFIHYVDPHSPYHAGQEFRDRFVQGLPPPASSEVALGEVRQYGPDRGWSDWLKKPSAGDLTYLRGLYQGEVAYVDAAVGKLRERLEAIEAIRDPIVMITADHGEAFNEHGIMEHTSDLHEPVTRVPLILWGVKGEPRRIETPVRTLDLAPTLLELAAAPRPEGLDGRSLVPLLSGLELPPAPAAAIHFIDDRPEYALTLWPWKLIAAPDQNRFQLFDLERDPAEANDLAGSSPRRLAMMREILDGLLQSSSPDFAAPPLDEETIRRLKDLNY